MSIEVANESGTAVDEVTLAGLARYVLDAMHIHPLAELSVLLVDADTMADLHQRWMGEPGPTDVLAFPMDELRPPPPGSDRADRSDEPGGVPGLIGDVVLCPEVAAQQALAAHHPVADELQLLCTHGILHLLGYDHAEPEGHAAMFGLQDRLLGGWQAARTGHAAPGAGQPGAEHAAPAGQSGTEDGQAGQDGPEPDEAG